MARQKEEPTAAGMIRDAAAQAPVEESFIRAALVAISKALQNLDALEWKAVYLDEAREALEAAAYSARHFACKNGKKDDGGCDERKD